MTVSNYKHSDPMIFAVADIDVPAIDKHSVGPCHFAGQGIAVGPVSALPGAGDGGNDPGPQVDPTDGVVFRIRDVEIAVGRVADSFGAVERGTWRPKLRGESRSAVACITQLPGSRQSLELSFCRVDRKH